MSWFVDNAKPLYVLLGVIAAGLVAMCYLNKRVKFLGYAIGVIVFMGLLWLITQYGTSDAQQLESNVHAMADAVERGNVDELFKHVSKDFSYHGKDREFLSAAAQMAMRQDRVRSLRITSFRIEELSRADKSATTSFLVRVSGDGEGFFRTKADFVLEGDKWKLKTMRFYNPAVDQDKEISLPGLP
jgi:hypothetical protein